MQGRLLLFNVELWHGNIPNKEGKYEMSDNFYDLVYSELITSLSKHLKIDKSKISKSFLSNRFENKRLQIKFSKIHNQFFGRMSLEDEDDVNIFMLELEYNHQEESSNNYLEYFHQFSIHEKGIKCYCNIGSWYDKESLNKNYEDKNVINIRID
uniref:Uncharacterized protein n=1 Tax=viral metagenome TaxID=1070528 RepID=A0A6C0BCR2_9ZZZZ